MDGYYDHDTGRRSPRRTLIGLAAVLAALCAAFLLGYASHGGTRANADPGTKSPSPVTPTPPPPTADVPSGQTLPTSTAPAAGPREPLRRNSAGVIAGYRHDQAGAVAAAGNYTASLYVQTNRTHARELAVLSTIAASQADAERMAGDFATEDAALAQLLGVATVQSDGVIAYGHPQGYRVESVTTTAATIDVYVAGGQGVAAAPSDSPASGETFYEVDQAQLVWQRGDWRMANWSHLVEDDGPELATIAAEGYRPFPIGEGS
jgi:hypothetical protein